jgi:hypothetical protein
MKGEPSFLVELLRRHPAGPVLQIVGLAALGVLWFNFAPGVPMSVELKLAGLGGVIALACGMWLTHRDSLRLQAERRGRSAARTGSPWDAGT